MPLRTSYQLRRHKVSRRRTIRIALVVSFIAALMILLRIFYVQNTIIAPAAGGTYIEGSIGQLSPLNPWFTVTNDVNRDIVSLVFAGLQRYNPATKQIEDDLATMEVDEDGRLYTLKLKEDIFWHDHTPEVPHPVTIDDVLFTFSLIQEPGFENTLLQQNFSGVQIEQIDERSIRFRLREPYRFFPSNLTLGLLPKRSFEGIPVQLLSQTFDFGYNPIGAGPYMFKGLVQTELSTEVTLERFSAYNLEGYHLDSIVFRIFPDYDTLLSDLRNLQGVRLVPRNKEGTPLIPDRYESVQYTLPQYVALFFNLDRTIVDDNLLRLGLQLGTNKQELVDLINEEQIIDTPLLELADEDWRFHYDLMSAKGALFQSDWNLPEKVRLQRMLELYDANKQGVLQTKPVVNIDGTAVLVLSGSIADVRSLSGSRVNDFVLTANDASSGSWLVSIPAFGDKGLQEGINRLQLINDQELLIDTFYVQKYADVQSYKLALKEWELVGKFANQTDENRTLEASDFYLEKGFLRLKTTADPTDIRIDSRGNKLAITLLTSKSPPAYTELAMRIKEQWRELGVHVNVEIPETRAEFERRMLSRQYDVLLFGQSLLDNLDSYPYWHSSGVQENTDQIDTLRIDAYNLSQYKSLEADALLELIRKTDDLDERARALTELRDVLVDDIPAIVLYSPLYTYAYHTDVHGVALGKPSLHSDRFLTLQEWYTNETRQFITDKSWFSFFGWLVRRN